MTGGQKMTQMQEKLLNKYVGKNCLDIFREERKGFAEVTRECRKHGLDVVPDAEGNQYILRGLIPEATVTWEPSSYELRPRYECMGR